MDPKTGTWWSTRTQLNPRKIGIARRTEGRGFIHNRFDFGFGGFALGRRPNGALAAHNAENTLRIVRKTCCLGSVGSLRPTWIRARLPRRYGGCGFHIRVTMMPRFRLFRTFTDNRRRRKPHQRTIRRGIQISPPGDREGQKNQGNLLNSCLHHCIFIAARYLNSF